MFWQNQPLQDMLYLVALAGWGLVALLLATAPGLIGLIWKSYQYHRTGGIGIYIGRFIPEGLFSYLVDFSRSLSLSIVLMSGAVYWGYLPSTISGLPLLAYMGGCVGGLWVLSLLRRMSYALWQYVFMEKEEGELLEGDHLVLSLLGSILLVAPSLLALAPQGVIPSLWLTAGILALILLLRFIQTIRRLSPKNGAYIYIFLYLCTHELLPWIYIATAVYVGMGG